MTSRQSTSTTAGVAASAGFVGIAAFQAALALGAPLGKAAYGGGSAELSSELHIVSTVAVPLWLLAAATVRQRAGLGEPRLPPTFVRRGTWTLVGIMSFSTLLNLASRSLVERYTWGPIALILTVLCAVVARSGEPDQGPQTGPRIDDGQPSVV